MATIKAKGLVIATSPFTPQQENRTMMSPDQFDMMEAHELRAEIRAILIKMFSYREALESIANTDYRGTRSPESGIAYRVLKREDKEKGPSHCD